MSRAQSHLCIPIIVVASVRHSHSAAILAAVVSWRSIGSVKRTD